MRYETKYTKLLIEQFTLICMHFTKVVPLYIGMPWHGCPSITYIHFKNPIFTFNLLPISTPNKNWGRKVGVIKNLCVYDNGKVVKNDRDINRFITCTILARMELKVSTQTLFINKKLQQNYMFVNNNKWPQAIHR